MQEKVHLDPQALEVLQERLDLGYKLFKKHGVTTTAALREIHSTLGTELSQSHQASSEIDQLTSAARIQLKELQALAAVLHEARVAAGPTIASRVNGLLHLVGMPNARLMISVTSRPDPNALGMDAIDFQLDANKSNQFLPLYKAASGGEMSRIMLCIKSLTAAALQLPTLIFDEVDTGISGEAARQVGILLRGLADHHQIICITHQPQVAARGNAHFFVYKNEEEDGRITTKVRTLAPEERIQAIARMIGGEQPGEAALQHARELVTP
jgi:DNA repair protein RecN (Recombination protein N)